MFKKTVGEYFWLVCASTYTGKRIRWFCNTDPPRSEAASTVTWPPATVWWGRATSSRSQTLACPGWFNRQGRLTISWNCPRFDPRIRQGSGWQLLLSEFSIFLNEIWTQGSKWEPTLIQGKFPPKQITVAMVTGSDDGYFEKKQNL